MRDCGAALNPGGGAEPRRDRVQPALHDRLMERIVARVEAFPAFAWEQWVVIRAQLLDGSYRPQPVRRVFIDKRGGGQRPLGIPSVPWIG